MERARERKWGGEGWGRERIKERKGERKGEERE